MNIKKIIYFLIILLLTIQSSFSYAEETYIRGTILHFLSNPDEVSNSLDHQLIQDGLLIVKDGKIIQVGDWEKLKNSLPKTAHVIQYQHGLIVPGFIDTHVHYPQLDMIAADSGGHLIEWLNKYTFPFEQKFKNKKYADNTADFFVNELLRNGTTTAFVFATIYPQAVDAIFEAAEKKQMRLIAGKVMGDRNLPPFLIESPDKMIEQTSQLIEKWNNKPNTRLMYAITFRFAPTTSPTLFEKIELLKQRYPDVYIHTHISENKQEVKWSNDLFNTKNYLDIYDRYHLLGKKTLLAHGVYLSDKELKRINETHTHIAFCPTSNLFLGSGLFNLSLSEKNHVSVGLGTDVGAGTSFSLLQTMNEAYKVQQLQNQNFSAWEGFYLATLGGARALDLEDKLGNFLPGKEADFVILDLQGATPLIKRRFSFAKTFEDKLFVLMTLGDDRSVVATFVNGKKVYSR